MNFLMFIFNFNLTFKENKSSYRLVMALSTDSIKCLSNDLSFSELNSFCC